MRTNCVKCGTALHGKNAQDMGICVECWNIENSDFDEEPEGITRPIEKSNYHRVLEEKDELLQQVAELTKENEDAKFWAEEQAKGLNAAANRNAELSSELTKANHNILALTEQVEGLNKVIDVQTRMLASKQFETPELDRLREREKELQLESEQKDKEYESLEKEHDSLTEQVENLKEKVLTLDRVLKENHDQAQQQWEQDQAELSRLREERKELVEALREFCQAVRKSDEKYTDWVGTSEVYDALFKSESLLSKFEEP